MTGCRGRRTALFQVMILLLQPWHRYQQIQQLKQMVNNKELLQILKFVCSALPCPARDTRCAAADGSNVLTTASVTSDQECGGEKEPFV